MPVREFLRGGYQEINEPTIITSRGYVLFTVMPGPSRKKDSTPVRQDGNLPPGPTGPSPNGG